MTAREVEGKKEGQTDTVRQMDEKTARQTDGLGQDSQKNSESARQTDGYKMERKADRWKKMDR